MALASEHDPDPDPGALIQEGISQMVAQAMIPVRQEINAGLRNLDQKVDALGERVGRLETDVAEIKSDIATIKEILLGESEGSGVAGGRGIGGARTFKRRTQGGEDSHD